MPEVESLAGVFQALSDPLRLRLLKLLPADRSTDPICVCDLAKRLGVSQPNASHHLKVLKSVGLIRCNRQGGYAYYQVDKESLKGALDAAARGFLVK